VAGKQDIGVSSSTYYLLTPVFFSMADEMLQDNGGQSEKQLFQVNHIYTAENILLPQLSLLAIDKSIKENYG